jgi:hypothetical protein
VKEAGERERAVFFVLRLPLASHLQVLMDVLHARQRHRRG